MKTLSSKICPQCKKEFTFESWNKKKTFCSRLCKDTHSRGSRQTTEEWILRAIKIHGEKYSYELVDLDNKKNDKIEITCKLHGPFWQRPSQHIIGKGCKECAKQNQFLTNSEFIFRGNKIHNNKYDYSLVNYKHPKEHVTIRCPEHGIFLQTPRQHLYHSAGCHICSQIYTSSKGEKDWLDSLCIDNEYRQVVVESKSRKFIVDGLFENTIYEYLGDFWHGNPALYLGDEINPLARKTYGDLYRETLDRFRDLEKLGYKIIYIWESEWHQKK